MSRRDSDQEGAPQPEHSGMERLNRVSAQAMGLEANALCDRTHWVPKSLRAQCSNCKRGFKLFSAKHHCRLCGDVVCGTCSSKRILFQRKSVRACNDCVTTSIQSILDGKECPTGSKTEQPNLSALEREIDAVVGKRIDQKDDKRIAPSAHAVAQEVDGSKRKVTLMKPTQNAPACDDKMVHCSMARYRSQRWRSQVPYAIALFLLTLAGITNVWSLT